MKTIYNRVAGFTKLNIDAITNLINHDGVEHAGYMAFISLLSFFPFLVFLMAVTGFIGKSGHGIELINLILSNLPADLIQAIKPRVEEIISGPPSSLLTISILGVIWTSSSTVEGLRTILNKIYGINSPPTYLWRRTLSIFQFFIITAILVVATFILLFLPILYQDLSHLKYLKPLFALDLPILTPIWDNFRRIIFIIMLFLGVMYLYYTTPNTKLNLRSLVPGAFLVVILWFISGYMLSAYVYDFTQVNFVYGSLTGFITTLLYFYILHIIFIYGAELNNLLDKSEHRVR